MIKKDKRGASEAGIKDCMIYCMKTLWESKNRGRLEAPVHED